MIRRKGATSVICLLASLTLIAAACSDDDESSGDTTTEAAGQATTTAAGGDTTAADGATTTAAGTGSTAAPTPSGGSVLDDVIARDSLKCGVNDSVPGFGFTDEQGQSVGFDIDYCKALAASVLGDPTKVEFIVLTPDERFPALSSGEIDVLIRNTTWTASRDGGNGAAFVKTTYYDGQAMMVRADAGFTDLESMTDATICMTAGTTTEQNLASRFVDIPHNPQTYGENSEVQEAFIAGQCDGWTSDASQLAGIRSNWPADQGGPESLLILDEVFSKEPLGPAVRDGDTRWYDAVNWTVLATMYAEELGITQDNVEEMKTSTDPAVLRLLGQPVPDPGGGAAAVFDPGLGLPAEFAANAIAAVGNYGEIYDRNVGPDTPLAIDREGTANALAADGGLHYVPPFR
jgi:general L-amino acid transport system substrate-binding protein